MVQRQFLEAHQVPLSLVLLVQDYNRLLNLEDLVMQVALAYLFLDQ